MHREAKRKSEKLKFREDILHDIMVDQVKKKEQVRLKSIDVSQNLERERKHK